MNAAPTHMCLLSKANKGGARLEPWCHCGLAAEALKAYFANAASQYLHEQTLRIARVPSSDML